MKEVDPQPASALREAALAYASRGWPVFRLAGKVPLIGSHGLKDATTDLKQITTWWSEKPDANIGLATGAVSGLIVVDLDPRHGAQESLIELEKRYGKLPSTRLSRTARGGIHRLYRHPQDGQTYGNAIELDKLPGIDVRGEGGYIVAPPSTLFGGKASYTWVKEDFPIATCPAWLLKLIVKANHAPDPQISQPDQTPGKKWVDHYASIAAEGNRNQRGFQLACQLRDDHVPESEAEGMMYQYVARVGGGKTPYTVKEALASLRSAYRRPARPPARRM